MRSFACACRGCVGIVEEVSSGGMCAICVWRTYLTTRLTRFKSSVHHGCVVLVEEEQSSVSVGLDIYHKSMDNFLFNLQSVYLSVCALNVL